jgi:hypothetical protein
MMKIMLEFPLEDYGIADKSVAEEWVNGCTRLPFQLKEVLEF